MSEQEKPGDVPGIIALDAPTLRATASICTSEDGAFGLTFYDNRTARNTSPDRMFLDRALHEVVKLALSPIALRKLRKQLDAAIAQHESSFGPIPSLEDQVRQQNAVLHKLAIESATALLRQPEAPPEV